MGKVEVSPEFIEEDENSEELEDDDLGVDDLDMELDLDLEVPDSVNVEDLDPNEPIWPEGPKAGQIVAWKKQYGDVFVSSFSPEVHVVWRTLNRFEYRNHMKRIEQMARSGQVPESEATLVNEESLCEICVLFPKFNTETLMTEMAGLPSALAQDILEASGFVALEVRKL